MESIVCCAHMLHVTIGYNGIRCEHVLILVTQLCWIFSMQGALDSLTHVQFSDDSDDSMLFVTSACIHSYIVGICIW